MDEKQYLIPESLLKAVTNYLMTRPYSEVYQAMPALSQLKQHSQESMESKQ